MTWELTVSPLIPVPLLALAGLALILLTAFALWRRGPGTPWRLAAYAAIIAALANPAALQEEREPLPDVAVLVVDTSASNHLGDRADLTSEIAAKLADNLRAASGLDLRIVETDGGQAAEPGAQMPGTRGTQLFAAAETALADVPPDRVAGIVAVTDGQIHDSPPRALTAAGAPFHAILTGARNERDRILVVEEAPRFAIVGEPVALTVRIDDTGSDTAGGTARLAIRIDGDARPPVEVPLGQSHRIEIELDHGGENVIELEAAEGLAELTLANNRAVVVANGIRERLRVLLVSGEPHAGERTWRNLLKADPAVDLIHFTILRPPEKQDGTPINELSLIAFPTRELFSVKLNEFDLIIFDRYRRRGVLPISYIQNIADYVDNGGALLMAAGPDFASPFSIFRTPLAGVLPASPTGDVVTGGFHPAVTPEGSRHPVTAGLPGSDRSPPNWGRWFRLIDAETTAGITLMEGTGNRPLMVLDRVGEGRVAQLLSDHAWLWTRGFEGGGPQAELLRRLAHWLMKEPDLEEEALRAHADGAVITVTRQTMAETVAPVTSTAPDGAAETLELARDGAGRFMARLQADQMGLYRFSDGTLTAIAGAGPLNPKEFSDVRVTETRVAPVAAETGGSVRYAAEDGIPDIRRTRPGRTAAASTWIGLRENAGYAVRAITERDLIRPELALLVALGALMLAWRRESR